MINRFKNYSLTNKIRFLFLISLILALIFIAIFAKYIVKLDPYETDSFKILLKPNSEHILGCDQLGRDIFSRMILGIQSSLRLAFIGVSILFIIGTTLGVTAGYYGGMIESFIMRISDMMLAFPGTVLSIAIVGVLGPGVGNTLLALIIPGWAEFARLSRALTISTKENEYIKTAVLNKNNNFQIIIKYILPNIIPQLLIYMTVSISAFILKFSGLAFLGLGFKPPSPELGVMLSEAKDYMQLAPFYMLYPGLALFIIVYSYNSFANFMRDSLDKGDLLEIKKAL